MVANKAELQRIRYKLRDLKIEEERLSQQILVDEYITLWKSCADIKEEMDTLLKQKLAAKGISRQAYNKAKAWYDYSYKKDNRYLTAVEGDSSSIQSLIDTSGKTANELKLNADERRQKAARTAIKARQAAAAKRKRSNENKLGSASTNSSKKTENDLKKQDDNLARLRQQG